jgi:polyribonucleotide nucleotidyltransferase
MQSTHSKITIDIGGRPITFETGKIARQANGAVWVSQGETIVFATACAEPESKEDADFLPLRVDHQEKFSAAGRTLSGYIKREGRPNERETLVSRLIDRPLRPLFPDGYYNETQVLTFVWSYDKIHLPDVMAICAASAALVISDIPLLKPVGAVRVGLVDGEYRINPSTEEIRRSTLDLVLAGTEDAVLMIEGYADFLTEEQLLEAVEAGHRAIQLLCQELLRWREQVGKPKMKSTLRLLGKEVQQAVSDLVEADLQKALRVTHKMDRHALEIDIELRLLAALCGEEGKYDRAEVARALKKLKSKVMRKMIVEENVRCDGRAIDEIRPIIIEQGVLHRAHGSSLFTRGETQALAVCTLGGEGMSQRYEDLDGEGARRFYLQYFFPPFSVGEVGRMGPPGRREVGHGKLAERALQTLIPPREAFPYVIRLESNILESNGSSSMASVCGGCLAMMDAGVPLKRPVAGVAMGLVLEGEKYTILTDILGIEDALGDMDFKVTGDAEGVTAFQLDIKVEGITPAIMKAALVQAKRGRIHILEKMLEACPAPKEALSAYAPRIDTLQISPSKIGAVIGPGGKQIRAIIEETGVDIDIDDSGLVSLAGPSPEGVLRAKQIIHSLTAEIEVGQIYEGKVKAVVPFGVFVEIVPGKEGLCHISELDVTHIKNINEFIKEGEAVTVKVMNINERGQVRLSRRVLLGEGESEPPSEEGPRRSSQESRGARESRPRRR